MKCRSLRPVSRGWITLNGLGRLGWPTLCDFVFGALFASRSILRDKGWAPLLFCSFSSPFFAHLSARLSSVLPVPFALFASRSSLPGRTISNKYIDTQTTSCYSLPCLSNPILACSSLRNLRARRLSRLPRASRGPGRDVSALDSYEIPVAFQHANVQIEAPSELGSGDPACPKHLGDLVGTL